MAFVNLSNHSVEGWNSEQRDAAIAEGYGEPVDLMANMPVVEPSASTEEILEMGRSLATRVARMGARAAHVAGEYTLTYALVSLLQASGVECFAATTSRETVETAGPDGSIEKRAVFRFVRWRAYPRL